MNVAIVGSRAWTAAQIDPILEPLLRWLRPYITTAVSGGADGTDAAAASLCARLEIPVRLYLPEYTLWGRAAPLRRNLQIVQAAHLVVAFPGQGGGTWDTIRKAQQRAVPCALCDVRTGQWRTAD